MVAILTLSQKDSMAGQPFKNNSRFYPVQDKHYNWVISSQEINACTNEDFLFIKELPLIAYEDYEYADIADIKFNFSNETLEINLFETLQEPYLSVDITTLSVDRQAIMQILDDLILGEVPDCTEVIFSRRGGIIKINSASQGIIELVLPGLSVSDQTKYDNVGNICKELISE